MNLIKNLIKKIIPRRIWNASHWLVALAGAVKYKFPSRDLIVIGVTGTNGKSTVVQLLHDIFQNFGLNVASTSTIRFRIKDKVVDNKLKMTMPGRLALQKFLREAAGAGCQYAILEVTSEGLKQHRADFINFDCAVLTNVRPEHIESHGSFEKYRAAKEILFKKLRSWKKSGSNKISVVNLDDPSAFYYTRYWADEKIGYGLFQENHRPEVKNNFIPQDIKFSKNGVGFILEGEEYASPLLGDFNLYNVLAAIAVARAFEIPAKVIKDSLANFKGAPGRLEVLQVEPFLAAIDYAHTPDALESVYRVARSFWVGYDHKLIGVLGAAGGGRDKWKRPQMGEIAERFCDQIFLTDEDPYAEDPEHIIKDISRGIKDKPYKIIMDRRLAIREALQSARAGDAVLITGKGAEKTMMTRFGPMDWDERAVVLEELAKLSKK
ncbi:MAG: UDP-N-acetylmuramoyl-L-alanyl-D-glutamate--2,6-diaminopimelate ligase [Patescibacteria group bacterium]